MKQFMYLSIAVLCLSVAGFLGFQAGQGVAVATPSPADVTVETGILEDGAVIPLPYYSDGTQALESECRWIVSPYQLDGFCSVPIPTAGTTINTPFGFHVRADDREISIAGNDCPPWPPYFVKASYLIIAVRGADFATNNGTTSWGSLKK